VQGGSACLTVQRVRTQLSKCAWYQGFGVNPGLRVRNGYGQVNFRTVAGIAPEPARRRTALPHSLHAMLTLTCTRVGGNQLVNIWRGNQSAFARRPPLRPWGCTGVACACLAAARLAGALH
jgi:hypothetical protein